MGAPDGHDDPHTRRRLLGRAGLAAAAGTGLGALGSTDLSEAMRAAPVTAFDIRDFGAVGDGRTDDRGAIQAALDAVHPGGGTVFLPPGDYVVGGPLAPRPSTLLLGTHTPRYEESRNPTSQCKLRVRAGFDGPALVVATPEAKGVVLRDLALVGDGVGDQVHGIRMPDASKVRGEQSWTLEQVTIAGFTGDAIHGRIFVWTVAHCHLHSNRGWGIAANGENNWTDAYVHDTMVYFNEAGGVLLAGEAVSGLVHFVNCRFERSGGRGSDTRDPRNPAAPGIRLTSAKRILFANCSTDANMGNGLEVIAEDPDAVERLAHVYVTNCVFGRDGTGDQRRQGEFAGVKIRGFSPAVAVDGANEVKFSNCMVGTGKAADDGSGAISGPRYGVWFENTLRFQWHGGAVEGVDRAFHQGSGGNQAPSLEVLGLGMATLPLEAPGDPVDGMTYVDRRTSRLMVRIGGTWRSADLR